VLRSPRLPSPSHRAGNLPNRGRPIPTLPKAALFDQRAPFKVQDVAQVVVTPLSHLMHAATHCLKSFRLYDGKRLAAHLLVVPVTSPSGEQETIRTARIIRPAARSMRPPQLALCITHSNCTSHIGASPCPSRRRRSAGNHLFHTLPRDAARPMIASSR